MTKLRITRTQTHVYEPQPEHYPEDKRTPEGMLEVDLAGVRDDPDAYFCDQADYDEQITGAIVEGMSEVCVIIRGPSATGKSSVGRALAEKLSKNGISVDLDDRIDHPGGLPETAYCRGLERLRRHGVRIEFDRTV